MHHPDTGKCVVSDSSKDQPPLVEWTTRLRHVKSPPGGTGWQADAEASPSSLWRRVAGHRVTIGFE